jgi:hypothetical protein
VKPKSELEIPKEKSEHTGAGQSNFEIKDRQRRSIPPLIRKDKRGAFSNDLRGERGRKHRAILDQFQPSEGGGGVGDLLVWFASVPTLLLT